MIDIYMYIYIDRHACCTSRKCGACSGSPQLLYMCDLYKSQMKTCNISVPHNTTTAFSLALFYSSLCFYDQQELQLLTHYSQM